VKPSARHTTRTDPKRNSRNTEGNPEHLQRHRCKTTPNTTNARRNIENIASRAPGNGARNRSLRAESSRNQVSLQVLVDKAAISRAGVGDHFRKSLRCRVGFVPRWSGAPRRGHQSAHGSGQAGFSVQQKNYREPPIASTVGGNGARVSGVMCSVRRIFRKQPGIHSPCLELLSSLWGHPCLRTSSCLSMASSQLPHTAYAQAYAQLAYSEAR
jgi:hypothetical protein